MTDWIEEIFDYCDTTGNRGNVLVGFVDSEPVCARWESNVLTFRIIDISNVDIKSIRDEILNRLKEREDPGSTLTTEIKVDGLTIEQSFYFEDYE